MLLLKLSIQALVVLPANSNPPSIGLLYPQAFIALLAADILLTKSYEENPPICVTNDSVRFNLLSLVVRLCSCSLFLFPTFPNSRSCFISAFCAAASALVAAKLVILSMSAPIGFNITLMNLTASLIFSRNVIAPPLRSTAYVASCISRASCSSHMCC